MSHAGHGRTEYSCGHVQAQCRCMDAGKTVTRLAYPCASCQANGGPGPEAALKAEEDRLAHVLLYAVKDVGMLDKRGRLEAWQDAIDTVKGMHARLDAAARVKEVDLVFDGPPGPEGPRFIEAERAGDGTSVSVGEWRQDGVHWKLRVRVVLP